MSNIMNIGLNRATGNFENFVQGRYTAITAEQTKALDERLKEVIRSNDPAQHQMLATTIVGPIQQYADYQEWLKGVLLPKRAKLIDVVRVALDSPTMIAFLTVPNGAPNFLRPGRLYTTVSPSMYDVALEIGKFDRELFGWDVLTRKIKEAGDEMARQRDTLRLTPIDTAVAALSGHTSTVATTMSKASVDAIFNAAATAGFKIINVRINTGTIMDMTGWTWDSNSMWNRLGSERAEQVVEQGYITGYGGATWQAFTSTPAAYVYFFGEPRLCGYEWSYDVDGAEYDTDYDITTRSFRYVWSEFKTTYAVANAIWRLQIT